MKLIYNTEHPDLGEIVRVIGIELTRRNLRSLLAKLDEPESARTILKGGFFVKAVADEDHYETEGRRPGRMSARTEATLAGEA